MHSHKFPPLSLLVLRSTFSNGIDRSLAWENVTVGGLILVPSSLLVGDTTLRHVTPITFGRCLPPPLRCFKTKTILSLVVGLSHRLCVVIVC